MEAKKKQSLFKQRVKEAQNKEKKMEVDVNMTGFPAVIKIETESNEPSESKLNNKMDTGFLNQMKVGQYIDQNEYNTIDQQNSKYLNGLSEEEIESMKKQIMQQLSPNFISKLNLKKYEPGKQTNMKQNQQQKIVTPQQPLPLIQPSLQQSHPIQPPQLITPSLLHLRPQQLSLLDDLTFNILTLTLSPSPRSQQNPKLIEIHTMLSSDQNQTVLVGINLFRQILSLIQTAPWSYDLLTLNNHYYHRKILLTYIYKRFVKEVWRRKYLRCGVVTLRVEGLEGVADYLKAGGEVEEKVMVGMLEGWKEEGVEVWEKIKEIRCVYEKYSPETVSLIKDFNINIVITPTDASLFFANLNTLTIPSILPSSNSSITILSICQKLLLEQLHFPHSPQISALNKLSPLHDPSKIPIIFLTVQYLKFKQMYSKEPFIKQILASINVITKSDWNQLHTLVTSSSQTQIYQILYIYKQTNLSEFIQYLHALSQTPLPSHSQLQKVLFLLNIEQYLDNEWTPNEISLITESLLSILNFDSTIEPTLLFCSLLALFTNSKQSYFLLDQQTLDHVFKKLVKKMRLEYLSLIMSMERVKELVSCYVYNSFGNVVFSRVMLLLSSAVMREEVQVYVVGEVYYRYPGILMEAGRGELYGGEGVYGWEGRSERVKGDLEKIVGMVEEDRGNRFYRIIAGEREKEEEGRGK